MDKPILCLDFDGVLHSYSSGWKGAGVIPDQPVRGALWALLEYMEHFEVHIHSSRSHQWGGRRAMKHWLRLGVHAYLYAGSLPESPEWLVSLIDDEWPDRMEPFAGAAMRVSVQAVRRIHFPRHKPPALVTLDDRGITFTGEWPTPEALLKFRPWNKREPAELYDGIRTRNWRTDQIDINKLRSSDLITPAQEMRPTELHHRSIGELNNGPSFCLVMEHPTRAPVFCQVTFAMLSTALDRLGYKLSLKE